VLETNCDVDHFHLVEGEEVKLAVEEDDEIVLCLLAEAKLA